MADQQHRATAQQWRDVKAMAFGSLAYSTILELRDRIEALEAAAKSNHPAKPDSSLVEQVAAAIHPNVCADPNLYLHEARAAIRVVAAWLSEHAGGTDSPLLLEREAER
jgi:hypothetical protein